MTLELFERKMRGWNIIVTIYEHTQNDKSHKTYTNNVTHG